MENETMLTGTQERTPFTSPSTPSREAEVPTKQDKLEALRQKYKSMDGKIYEVTTNIQEDDDDEKEFDFIFRKPGVPSYERYAKLSGTSTVKALKTFVLDNICEEQNQELKDTLEEYPAMGISLGEKLLNMLGLSKDTRVKKL